MLENSTTSEQELYALAAAKAGRGPQVSGPRARVEEDTRERLTGLARSLGYHQATATFDAAPSPG